MAKSFILTRNHLIPQRFLEELGRELRAGKLAAFPTDTVYGLGTSAENDRGVELIYRLKGRSPLKPLPLLVESPAAAWRYAQTTPQALALAQKYWPGPLTLVLWPTAEGKRLLRGHPTIGLRVPKHRALLAILEQLGVPLASTSANLSGQPATGQGGGLGPLEAAVDYVVLEEEPLAGLESTVVDLADTEPRILREGAIPGKDILELLASMEAA
jgi:L-threonylcarbamoyladenylate synthase